MKNEIEEIVHQIQELGRKSREENTEFSIISFINYKGRMSALLIGTRLDVAYTIVNFMDNDEHIKAIVKMSVSTFDSLNNQKLNNQKK